MEGFLWEKETIRLCLNKKFDEKKEKSNGTFNESDDSERLDSLIFLFLFFFPHQILIKI